MASCPTTTCGRPRQSPVYVDRATQIESEVKETPSRKRRSSTAHSAARAKKNKLENSPVPAAGPRRSRRIAARVARIERRGVPVKNEDERKYEQREVLAKEEDEKLQVLIKTEDEVEDVSGFLQSLPATPDNHNRRASNNNSSGPNRGDVFNGVPRRIFWTMDLRDHTFVVRYVY